MSASVNDKFQLISASGTVPNVPRVTATRSAAGTSLTVDNCNWDTTTGKIFSTYQVDTSGNVVAGTQTIWKGVVNSSTSIGSMTRLAGASDTGNAIGDYVEIIPDSEWVNNLVSGILSQHNQDGTHSNITATTADFTGAVSANTISEHTAASGVTVDGLLIKDNYVVGSATSGIKNESLGTAATDLGSAWQTGTPAATGFSSKTDDALVYKQIGKTMFCNFKIEGTSNATTLTFTLPAAAKNTTSYGGIRTANSGAFGVNPGLITFAAASATATCFRDHSSAAFTNTGTKGMQGFFFYEAA